MTRNLFKSKFLFIYCTNTIYIYVYTHKFTRTLLLLHLCLLHTKPISSQFSVKFSHSSKRIPERIFPESRNIPDECPTTCTPWMKGVPVNITREPTFFSTHAHFPRLRIALTLELEQSKWIRGEKRSGKRIVYPFVTLILGYVPTTRT